MPAASDRPAGPPAGVPDLPHTWRPMGVRFAVVGFGLMGCDIAAIFLEAFEAITRLPQDVVAKNS